MVLGPEHYVFSRGSVFRKRFRVLVPLLASNFLFPNFEPKAGFRDFQIISVVGHILDDTQIVHPQTRFCSTQDEVSFFRCFFPRCHDDDHHIDVGCSAGWSPMPLFVLRWKFQLQPSACRWRFRQWMLRLHRRFVPKRLLLGLHWICHCCQYQLQHPGTLWRSSCWHRRWFDRYA